MIGNPEGGENNTKSAHPKNRLRLFCLKNYLYFLRLFWKTLPKIPFKTSIWITSWGYFYFLRLLFASRGYSTKRPQKIVRGRPRSRVVSWALRVPIPKTSEPNKIIEMLLSWETGQPAKSKRGREEGDGTENVINCRDVCRKLSWHFMTTYDDLWRFM